MKLKTYSMKQNKTFHDELKIENGKIKVLEFCFAKHNNFAF